jgi:hypothetical protein
MLLALSCGRLESVAVPELNTLAHQVYLLQPESLMALQRNRPLNGRDPLGLCAHQLRQLVVGTDGFMSHGANAMLYMVSFAAHQVGGNNGAASSAQHYHAWLKKVALHEFADELVLSATAKFLDIVITVVPATPSNAAAQWRICEMPCHERQVELGYAADHPKITLGNNDVHYVMLSR